MRPHPLLAITSAIFIIGAGGTLGDAALTSKATALAIVHRRVHAPTTDVVPRPLVARFARKTSSLVIGTYRTAPLPYLFTATSHRHRHAGITGVTGIGASGIGFELKPTAAASSPQWLALRECESNNNYQDNTGNGYYGAYQFAPTTWWSLGFSGLPNQAPPSVQDAAARMLQKRSGWSSWPICSVVVGL